MALFSERYGYTKVSDVIIREKITLEIQNAICSCFDQLEDLYASANFYQATQSLLSDLEKEVWTKFLNQRLSRYNYHSFYITDYIENDNNEWFLKLNYIEFIIKFIYEQDNQSFTHVSYNLITLLNTEFERLNFAYRIVEQEIVEITSEQEIKTIESAINNSPLNIQMHLNSALEKYAQRPNGDYRNSIKESISAVEAFCRDKTGESTLGKALSNLEKKNIIIPQSLSSAFLKLYEYTNHADTGIRHALMDDNGSYTPTADEALFMLVSCSAFINYLSKKV